MQVNLKGTPVDLEGRQPEVGEIAPDFTLTNIKDEAITLSALKGKTILLSVFPNINTSVCDRQNRKFYEVAKQRPDLVILNISNNTKEEFQDWCVANGIEMEMLSDTDKTFAAKYGLWIPALNGLARSIFVIGPDQTILYREIVPEIATDPNYEAALAATR